MKREWVLRENTKSKSSKNLVERLLATRGIVKKEDVYEFLHPLETKITHPNAFLNMPHAVERISKAIDKEENILIYGDFDADGVTSTALLIRTLNHLGAKVSHFIPDRELHGHGLNSKALVKLMTVNKPKLIITVDCASSDVEQVDFINSFKIDVIITDHHETPEFLPNAYAIINPKAPDALDENLPAKEIINLTSLAGVGVAFKLAHALLEKYEKTSFVSEIMPYVTVGTIADVVPLIGENRYFVAKGLELISAQKHWGLARLLELAGYDLSQGVTSENIAFGVAPRINASGRLDTVEDALKVLASDNRQEIEMAIISLNNYNKIRQELCDNTFLEAQEMLKNQGNQENSIILFNPKWHIGIIGIVASKLVEKYYKPVFLMTFSEETNQIRCSSRGVEELNIYDILSANSELFDGFGGHALAGGLSFSTEKTTFEDVKSALNKTINEILGDRKLTPSLKIDLEVDSSEVDIDLISQIDLLQPCGAANPSPVFVMNNLTLVQKKLMGANKNHLKLTVEDSKHNIFDCIWWSKGDISLISGDKLEIAFCPQINTFNGSTTIQLILQDIHSDKLVENEIDITSSSCTKIELKIYDHRKKTNIFSSVEDYVKSSKLNIAIFAEDRVVLEKLKPYKTLSEAVFNRTNSKNVDTIMFFDYPPNQDLLNKIIKSSNAKFLHFMNYEARKTDEKDFLKTFSGMLKFAHKNKDGIFNLEKSAAFLAVAEDTVTLLLEIFEECKMIKILDKKESEYKIEFTSNVEISKALHSALYKDFSKNIKNIEQFKKSILNEKLSNLFK